jgi:hypothetical protein
LNFSQEAEWRKFFSCFTNLHSFQKVDCSSKLFILISDADFAKRISITRQAQFYRN